MRPAVRKRWCSTFRFHATWKIWSRIILCIYLKFSSLSRICWTELHCSDLRCHTWLNIPYHYLKYKIISDTKAISTPHDCKFQSLVFNFILFSLFHSIKEKILHKITFPRTCWTTNKHMFFKVIEWQ